VCLACGIFGSLLMLFISKTLKKSNYGIGILRRGDRGDLLIHHAHEISEKLKIKLPEIGVFKSREISAFATGAGNLSLIALSTGLLERLSPNQIRAVLAHEISHVANGDMYEIAAVQGIISGFVLICARVFCGTFLIPTISLSRILVEIFIGLVGYAIVCKMYRSSEHLADAGAAKVVGAKSMIEVIEITQGERIISDGLSSLAVSPKNGSAFFGKIFSTHPSVASRISHLMRIKVK
jgi:heat shock protein HtpX